MHTTTMHIASLHIYPVKSCAGHSVAALPLDAYGARDDRRWMVVDAHGTMLTQRTHPALARVTPTLNADDTLTLHADGLGSAHAAATGAPERCAVWDDEVLVRDGGPDAAAFFSALLGAPARLVRMADGDGYVRRVDFRYAPQPAEVNLADGYPLLVVSTASLDDLNARLVARGKAPVSMSRFRPNVVLAGAPAPYAEDAMPTLRAGDVTLDLVKPCARCVMVTVDPATASVPDAKEPLGTLATYRRHNDSKVMFAMNAIARAPGGTLHVHTPVLAD